MRGSFSHALGRRLALSTALGTGMLLSPAALAQHVPIQSDVVGGTAGVTVTPAMLPASGPSPTASTITVTAPRSVINWKEFNVPTGTSATFTNAVPPATPLVPYAVLNRVVGSDGIIPSTIIDGALNAPSNMQIYIINSSGILFGSSAVVNVGGLVASTRNITDGEFSRAVSAMHFRPVTSESSDGTAFTDLTSGNGITVTAGARITTTGTPSAAVPDAGGLYLIGASVQSGGALTATGDAVMVAADDVTITPTMGSPLAITIARGTRIANAVNVTGKVDGRSVVLALASRDSVVNTLFAGAALEATGATVEGAGVVLTAGGSGGGVTLTPGAAGDIDAVGAISTTAAGMLTSAKGVTATAAGAIAMASDIAAQGAVSLSAGNGGAGGIGVGAVSGASITLRSAGLIGAKRLTATTGTVSATGTGGLTVTNEISATGAASDVVIDRTGAVSAARIAAGRDVTIGATTAPASVTVTGTTTAGRTLAVTTTGAQSFTGAITATTGTATLTSTGGAIGVGTVQARGDARLHGTAVTATSVASTNGVAALTADTGDVGVGGLGAGTDAQVNATNGAASITGAVTAGRDYLVAAKSATLGAGAAAATQQAARNVDITASTGTIAGGAGLTLRGAAQAGATGTLVLDGAGGIALDAGSTIDSVAPGVPAASGTLDVGIRAGNGASVALGAVTARGLTGADAAPGHALTDTLVLTGPVTLGGTVTVARSLDLSTSGGTLTTHRVDVTGTNADLTLTTTGMGHDLTALGALTAGRDLTFSAARDLTFTTAQAIGGAATATSGTASPTTATGLITGTSLTASGAATAKANSSLTLGTISGLAVTGTGGTTATIGNITAGAGATITAVAAASVTGAVDVTGDYAVTGKSVTLGVAGTPVTQSASGAVTIGATGGTITGASKLVLTSNDDDSAGAEPLTLTTSGPSGGDILFAGTTLNGGVASSALVRVDSGTADNVVTLGDVNALGLVGAVGGGGFTTGIARTSAITVGDVTLRQELLLDAGAAAITGGSLTGSSVTLSSTGAIGATALKATDGMVTVAGGGLAVSGAIGAAGTPGDIVIDGSGAVSAGSFSAGRDVTIGATTAPASVTVTGTTTAGRTLAVTTTGAQSFTGAITATTGTATLTSTGGAIGVGTVQARGDARLHGTAVTATSVASTNGVAALTADTGDVGVGGLGAGTDAQVNATNGAASITGAVTAGRDYLVAAKSATLGAGAAAATQQAARNVDITASTGTIAGGAGLTLRGAAQAGATGTLVLDGAGGIALDAGSTIDSVAPGVPAASGTLDVGIRAGNGASVALGAVTARGLTGADAAPGHALTDMLALTGPVTLGGTVTVARSLDLSTSGGTLTTHRVDVTGTNADLTLTTTGVGHDLTALGALTAGHDLTLSAARDLTFTTAQAIGGAATATSGTASPTTATGLITGTSLTASGAATAKANSSLTLGTISGLAVTGTGGTDVTISTASATSGLLQLVATAGTLRLTSGTGVGGVRLSAGGAAEIGTADATGPNADLTLVTATDVGGLIAGSRTSFTATRDLSLTATGTTLLTTASGGRNATVQAGTLDATSLVAGSGLAKATASTGALTIGTITAGAGAAIEATNGTAILPGTVAVTGDYAVTGRNVTLGVANTPVTQSASGAVTISAAATLTGSSKLTLLANSDGAGAEPLTLATTATGGSIAFAGTTLLGGPNSQSLVRVRSAAAGDGVVLGDITALGLQGAVGSAATVPFTTGITRTSALTVGTVTLKQELALSTSSTLTALALQGDAVTLRSAGTTAPIPSITATGGAVTIGGSGPFAVTGAISATSAPGAPGDILIDQAGPVTAGSLTAGNAITIGKTAAAASLTISGTTQAGGAVAVTTSGGQTYGGLVNAGGTATLIAQGGPLQLVDLTSAGNALLQGTTIAATSVKSSGGSSSLTASGAITVPTVSGVGVTATGGTIAIGTLADANSGTLKLSATSGGLSLLEGRAGGDVTLSAIGDALIGTATAGADLTITQAASVLGFAGGASRTTLTAGRDMTVTASGAIEVAIAQAAHDASLTGGSIDATTTTANGGTLTLTAKAGGLTVATARGAAGVTLSATGAAAIGTASATGGGADLVLTQAASLAGLGDGSRAMLSAGHDIDATVSGVMLVGPVSAGNLAKLTAGSIDLSTLDGGAATLIATGGDILATRVTVSGAATATALAGAVKIADIQAAATIVDAGTVDLNTVRGGTLQATSRSGPLHIAEFRISGDALLKAATDATIDTGTSTGGGIAIDAGGLITSPALSAATLLRANGAALTIGTATAGDVTLTATSGALELTSATATNTIVLTKTGTSGGIAVTGGLAAGSGNTGDITVASATSFVAPSLNAGRSVTVTTSGLTTLPSITTGALTIASTDAVALTTVAVGGDARVKAGGVVTLDGPATTGSLDVTGGKVTLGASSGTTLQQARGTLAFTATQGGIIGLSGLTLLSDSDGDGIGDLVLRGTTGIAFADGTAVLGGPDRSAVVRIAPGPGAPLTLDTLAARKLISWEPTLSATAFAHDGSVTIGTLRVRDDTRVALAGTGSTLTLGTADSAGGLTLATEGMLVAGSLQAATTLSAQGGTATIGSARGATVTLASTVGTLEATDATAGGDASLSAAGSLRLGTATAGGQLTVRAGGDVTGPASAGGYARTVLTGTSGVDVATRESGDAGGAVLVDRVASAGAISVAGRALDINSAVSSGGAISLAARPNGAASAVALSVGTVDAGTSITLSSGIGGEAPSSANGALRVDDAIARNGALTLTAADGSLGARDGVSGSTLTARGAAGDITATLGTTAIIASVDADRDIGITSGDAGRPGQDGSIAIGTATAGRAILLQTYNAAASGAAGIALGRGSAASASFRTLGSRGAISVGPLQVSGPVAFASVGDITLPQAVTAGDDITVTAAGRFDANDLSAGSLTADAGAASLGRVRASGDIAVAADTITAQDITSSGGRLTLTATGGDLALTNGTGAGTTTLSATGAATIGTLASTNADVAITSGGTLVGQSLTAGGGITARAASLTLNTVAANGEPLTLTTTQGDLGLTNGRASGAATLASAGAITIGTLQSSGGAIGATAAGALTAGTLDSAAGQTLTGNAISVSVLRAGGDLAATTGPGLLDLPNATVGGSAMLMAGGDTRLGALATRTGALTVRAGGQATATTLASGGDLTLIANAAMLGTVSAIGTVSTTSLAGDLSLGTVKAGADATLTSARDASVSGDAAIGGAFRVTGNGVTLDSADATATQTAGGLVALVARTDAITGRAGLALTSGAAGMTLTATGSNGTISLDPASRIVAQGGAITAETAGLATLGTVTAGTSATIRAADLTLANAVSGSTVDLVNRSPANLTQLGEAPASNANASEFAAGGARFGLSSDELGRISATELVVDAQSGAVQLSDTTLAAGAGQQLFQIRTSGRMDVLGRFVAAGSPASRVIVLGGDDSDAGRASVLRVASTAGGGGRLLADNATLDLRADRIAVGMDTAFQAALGLTPGGTAASASDVATRFVAQPSSTLYNAALGNAQGIYSDATLLHANSLVVRYADYALFQNTGLPGTTSGVILGAIAPAEPALELLPSGSTNAFALFGTVNGISGTAAALLGARQIAVGSDVSRGNSRANGCLIGAGGAGCLSNSIVQPTVNIFDVSRADVFRSAEDLTLPFDPLVSTSNEALFSDIASISQSVEQDPCPDNAPNCPRPGAAR